MKIRVLAADAPWKFRDKLPGKGRGAAKRYRVLTVKQLENFKLPPLHDDALLFFWRVSAMQEEALRVIRAWGFVPKSELIWQKLTKTGKRHFGMGRYVRLEHEVCIIAVRGRGRRWLKTRSMRSMFSAKVGEHSAKPDEFYELVEKLARGPHCELFARKVRKGWVQFGDELHRRKRRPRHAKRK
jgi:site-specific DNA-methyltransferase (adenine-specific)